MKRVWHKLTMFLGCLLWALLYRNLVLGVVLAVYLGLSVTVLGLGPWTFTVLVCVTGLLLGTWFRLVWLDRGHPRESVRSEALCVLGVLGAALAIEWLARGLWLPVSIVLVLANLMVVLDLLGRESWLGHQREKQLKANKAKPVW